MEKSQTNTYVLLKDGTVLEATAEQSHLLGMAILTAKDFSRQVKLGGRKFRLDEIEDDPAKIALSKQTGMTFENQS